jgi:hypothetical protein
MATLVYVIAAALAGTLIYLGLRYFVRASRRFGGAQVVICPETQKQAMVEVDTRRAALTSLIGQTDLRLESCWRWPLKKDCGQECLIQLAVAPPECLVRSVLKKWYCGKECAFCKRPFGEVELIDHKPALANSEGLTLEWGEISLPTLTDVLKTHKPVCWNCHIAQTFSREHPDLVVERSYVRQASCSRVSTAR